MSDSFDTFIQALSSGGRILITTHVRPDGDALGTTAALYLALKRKGLASKVLLLSKLPSKYRFLYEAGPVEFVDCDPEWPVDLKITDFDTLLVADTGTWSQLPGLKERIDGFKGKKLVLDHHLTQENWADLKLVNTNASAAGEITAELIERWGIEFDSTMATALWTAITADTGWFAYSSTSSHTLRIAAKLMTAGVDTDAIYQRLYQADRPQRLAVQARAMASLAYLCDGKVAMMQITTADFEKTGAKVTDTEGLVNLPLQVASVRVAILFTHSPEGGPIRISLRSKGDVDVASFAEQFAGGGHARAAGIKIEGTLEDSVRRVSEAMEKAFLAEAAIQQK